MSERTCPACGHDEVIEATQVECTGAGNETYPTCVSGQKYRRCCYGKDLEWQQDEAGRINKPMPISVEMADVLAERRKLVAKDGREVDGRSVANKVESPGTGSDRNRAGGNC
jgi:hypothetical protein